MQSTVMDLLEDKEQWILTIDRRASAREAIQSMVDADVGSIIVLDGDQPIGIFTERDYLRRVVLAENVEGSIAVEEVMTPSMICVDPDYTVEECMAIMTSQRCRHLPVMERGDLTAMVSIGDCTKQISREADVRIHHLEDYITGEYPR